MACWVKPRLRRQDALANHTAEIHATLHTASPGSGPAANVDVRGSEAADCDRTVISGAQDLEEDRGLRTHTG